MASQTHFETGRSKAEPNPGATLLADTVRNRRERLGITQLDIAEYFGGPSPGTLRAIEGGQSDSYRAKTLTALDRALGWPKGASQTLLTGRAGIEVWVYLSGLDENSRRNNRVDLNELVKHLEKRVDEPVAERFDLVLETPDDPFSPVEYRDTPGREFRGGEPIGPPLPVATKAGLKQGTQDVRRQIGNTYDRVIADLPGLLPDELDKVIDLASSLANVYRYIEGPLQQHVDEKLRAGMTRSEAMGQVVREMYPIDHSQDQEDQQ